MPRPRPARPSRPEHPAASRAARRRGRALAAVPAVLVGVLGALVAPALTPPAAAHDVLLEASPADGAVLDAPPAEVVLTFSADQVPMGAAILVTDAAGVDRAQGDVVVEGPTVRRALAPDLAAGAYRVEWRSVSSDGHALTGELTFEVAQGAPAVEEPAETTGTPDPSPSPSAEPTTAAEDATPTPTADPGTTDDAADDDAGGVPWWLVVALVVAAIGGAATAFLRRGR